MKGSDDMSTGKKVILVEYQDDGVIKTALLENGICVFSDGIICTNTRYLPNVRKVTYCKPLYWIDYEKIHDIIDTMMKEFDYSYEYVNGECEVFLRINVYRDSPRVECHTIPLDKSKLTIEHMKDISTYIKRFIR